MSNSKKWLKWAVEYRFVLIVLVIVVQNLIYTVYASLGLPGDDIVGICTTSASITMTSLGYVDIIPATDLARTISAYLVLFGQLYLAIQVAVLVGKLIKGSDSSDKERKKEIEDLKAQIRLLKSN